MLFRSDGQFAKRCNPAMVSLEKVLPAAEQEASVPKAIWHKGEADEVQLKRLLADHNRWTGSKRARDLLDNWAVALPKFVKVFPNEYKRALGEINGRAQTAAAPATTKTTGKQPAVAAK